jgi:hypothetical protein
MKFNLNNQFTTMKSNFKNQFLPAYRTWPRLVCLFCLLLMSLASVCQGQATGPFPAGGTSNGTKVQLWDYYANTAQLYTLTSTEVGQFRISPQCAPGSCLDVTDVSTSDGATVHLWQWLNAAIK